MRRLSPKESVVQCYDYKRIIAGMRLTGETQDRWVEELIDLCTDSSFVLNDGCRLTLITAARDLGGWLNDPRTYDRKHKPAWKSSIDDFEAAFEVLGPDTKAFVDPYMTSLSASLSHLPADLPSDPSAYRADAKVKHGTLETALNSEDFLTAAWRDLVEGCKDDNLAVNLLKLRRDNLWEAAKHQGHNVGTLGLGQELSGILENSAINIAMVAASLGDRAYPEYGEIKPQDPANLSINDRLTLCKRLFLSKPSEVNNVVWLCLQSARLPGVKLECGAVTFYDMEWLKGNLLDDGPSKHELPAELIGEGGHISKHDFPKGSNMVWARVDLGKGVAALAPEQARETMGAVLTLVDNDMRGWKLLGGYIAFSDGEQRTTSMFRPPITLGEYAPAYDHTPYMLKQLETELKVVTAATTTPMLSDALRWSRWLREIENAEPLSKLVVSVRVLELVSSWTTNGQKEWQGFSKDLLKDGWCQEFLLRELYSASYSALHAGHGLEKAIEEELGTMAKDVIEFGDTSSFQFHLDKVIVHLPRLIEIFKETPRARALKEVENCFASGTNTGKQLDKLSEDFERMLNRLVRYRNAAQHGGPIVDEVASTVDIFGHSLAMTAVQNTLRAVLDGKDLLVAQTDIKNDTLQRHRDLVDGSPSSRLFT